MGNKLRSFGAATGLLLMMVLMTPAAPEAAIQKRIDRGVKYLRSQQDPNAGTWPWSSGQQQTGATALAALTLLECEVPASDPAIQKAAQAIRQECPILNTTYALALAIMFFDRLGEPADVPLIQSLAVRLLAGQSEASGGWSYNCPVVGGEAEMRRLSELIKLRTPPPGKGEPAKNPPAAPKERRDVQKEIQDQLTQIIQKTLPQAGVDNLVARGDNSNTQFALLGLWIARRHGIPADKALELVELRFRTSQNADGGWGYLANMSSNPAMTCAGLLGLAVGHGVSNQAAAASNAKAAAKKEGGKARETARDPALDLTVRRGLLALGTTIGQPLKAKAFEQTLMMGRMSRGHYFLWSLERVGVAYGLDTIGRKDWYTWGAQLLLTSQEPDGSWQGEYAQGGVDTCFALLFLRRANLALDLTSSLKGRVQDPGEVLLTAGGVGGASLKEKGLKPAVEMTENSTAGTPRPMRTPGKSPPTGTPAAGDSSQTTAAGEVAAQFVKASAARQSSLLVKLREGKGGEYTQALADAIPQLSGPIRAQARDALAERLSRMNATTLRDKLQEENLEIRRAAALACVMREEKACVPDLIPLLKDPEEIVRRAAHVALKELTSQDFGPGRDATQAERQQAITRWQAWWAKQGGK